MPRESQAAKEKQAQQKAAVRLFTAIFNQDFNGK
jgi:hypothetical protein